VECISRQDDLSENMVGRRKNAALFSLFAIYLPVSLMLSINLSCTITTGNRLSAVLDRFPAEGWR
jgi:hypothetical protein